MKTNVQLPKTSAAAVARMIQKAGYMLACLVALLFGFDAVAQTPTTTVFTSSTTWTCPAGVTSVTVECWGGGGGGGGAQNNPNGGSGGGSGAYVKKVGIPVTPGTNYTVTVGTGGTGGSGITPTIVAGAGNPSWFGSTGTIFARGGCGALGNQGTAGVGGCSGGTTSTCINTNTCVPSVGDGFNNFRTAGLSGLTGTTTTGNRGGHSCASRTLGGTGGINTGGGAARTSGCGAGNNGTVRGAGGGGGRRDGSIGCVIGQNGGNGFRGEVIIQYTAAPTCPTPSISGFGSSTACVGETVTLNGTALYGCIPASATVGGVAVTSPITILEVPIGGPATVTFQVPAGATTGPVTFTHIGGTWTSGSNITIIGGPFTWNGSQSILWDNDLNWTPNKIPCDGADIIIPNVANQPVLSRPANVGNVTMNDGATLMLSNQPGPALPANLTILKNFIGGTSTAATIYGTGYAIMSAGAVPAVSQTISGRVQFSTLEINDIGGISLSSGAQVSIASGLHLQSGILNTSSGTLTLLSTASNNNSYIDDFTGGYTGSITGNVQVQRYVPTPGKNQHFISSPVGGAALSQIGASGSDGAYITPMSNCDKTRSAGAYGTVFVYNDVRVPAHTCAMANWHVQSSGNMVDGKGYSAYLTGNSILTVSGTPNTGNINVTGVHSGNTYVNIQPLNEPIESGWNLVGNPYPSTIVLNSIANNHAGFDNQIQVWQTSGPFSGSWQTLDMETGATIAPFQAFMVHRSSGGNADFHFYQNERSRATNTTFYRTESENSLTLEVNYNGSKDLTKIEFNPEATNGFDSEYDANKPGGNVNRPTLYTHLNTNMWYSTNTLPSLQEATVVPMGLAGLFDGTVTITAQGIQSFDPTTYIFLEDKKANVWHNLRNGDYTFTKTSTDNQNRFVVHFTPAAKILVTDAGCSGSGMINIEQPGSANWNYTLTDQNSTTISSGTLNSANAVSIQANAGIYNLTLSDQNGYTVMKNIEVKGTQPIVANFIVSATAAELNEEISFTATTANATSYHWDFGDGITATTKEVFHHYQNEGTYQVNLTVSNVAGCKSNRTQTVTVTSRSATALPNMLTPKPISIWSADNMVYVDFTQQKHVEAEIELYNVLGQMISSEKFGNSSIYSKQISNLAAAYIIVRVKNEENVTTKKVFISNR